METRQSAQVTTSACLVLDMLIKVSLTCSDAAAHPVDPPSFLCFTIQSFQAGGAEEQAAVKPEVVSGHIRCVYRVYNVLEIAAFADWLTAEHGLRAGSHRWASPCVTAEAGQEHSLGLYL